MELHAFIAQGSALALCPNREEIVESLAIIKPTLLLSVPALLNKVRECLGGHMGCEWAVGPLRPLYGI